MKEGYLYGDSKSSPRCTIVEGTSQTARDLPPQRKSESFHHSSRRPTNPMQHLFRKSGLTSDDEDLDWA